ncbi:MAG: hypothetical protein H6668_01380 [Ardenticatenaceae bacterium]|nr:hypothetical protein [Ardenticatenaceae bacterium]
MNQLIDLLLEKSDHHVVGVGAVDFPPLKVCMEAGCRFAPALTGCATRKAV